jgi:hypothetical protein
MDKIDKINPPTDRKTANENSNHMLYVPILSKPADNNRII